MKNNQSNRHEINSDHDNLPLFSVLNSNSGGGGGALLDGGTLPSSNDFDGIITFTSSDPLSAEDYPPPTWTSYASRLNHHQQQALQIGNRDN